MPYDLIAKGGVATGLVILIAFLVYWLTKELSKINNRVLDESSKREEAALEREQEAYRREKLLMEHIDRVDKNLSDHTQIMERITDKFEMFDIKLNEIKIMCRGGAK